MTEEIKVFRTISEFAHTYQEASRIKKRLQRNLRKKLERKEMSPIRISKFLTYDFDVNKPRKKWKIEYSEVVR